MVIGRDRVGQVGQYRPRALGGEALMASALGFYGSVRPSGPSIGGPGFDPLETLPLVQKSHSQVALKNEAGIF
jgi:hypothetical protein